MLEQVQVEATFLDGTKLVDWTILSDRLVSNDHPPSVRR